MTLVEAMISLAIFSMVGTMLFTIFSFSTKAWLKISDTVSLRDSGNLILSRLENELSASTISSVEVIVYPEKLLTEQSLFYQLLTEITGLHLIVPVEWNGKNLLYFIWKEIQHSSGTDIISSGVKKFFLEIILRLQINIC